MNIYILFVIFITTISQSYAQTANVLFWVDKITPALNSWWTNLVLTTNNILWYIIWLFYFISIIIWVIWWFLILISWGDEEKVKKGKNYILYMIYWLIIIFLLSTFITWIIWIMSDKNIVQ